MVGRRVGRPAVAREVEYRFWAQVGSGLDVADAAVAVGVSVSMGQRWVRQRGGVKPAAPKGAKSRPRLTHDDRGQIMVWRAQGVLPTEMARRLGKWPSTITRELKRVERVRADRHRVPYTASAAQADADERARRPQASKLSRNQRLAEEVTARLGQQHSPEQISNRLKKDFPGMSEMHVSHEAIYKELYVQSRGGLRAELTQCLRTRRRRRVPRRSIGERVTRFVDEGVNIADRPAEVNSRRVPGHWEGDLIVGSAASNSAIGTLVERVSRFLLLLHLPYGHSAAAVAHAMEQKMTALPEMLRRSLTWDQGSELAHHVKIADTTGMQVFFCDPHSPWQRGTNENTNGLLRGYFPKGTDLSVHGEGILDNVAAELNARPRETLHWKTPAEVLQQILSGEWEPPTFASTG